LVFLIVFAALVDLVFVGNAIFELHGVRKMKLWGLTVDKIGGLVVVGKLTGIWIVGELQRVHIGNKERRLDNSPWELLC
jgi:hypothetical protein